VKKRAKEKNMRILFRDRVIFPPNTITVPTTNAFLTMNYEETKQKDQAY
jgi:hypothetical protein